MPPRFRQIAKQRRALGVLYPRPTRDPLHRQMKERNHVDGSLQPLIVFEEVMHDFGNIEEGIKVSHNFQFSNTGDDTLRIKRVKGG